METHFGRLARATPLHRLQLELIVGSLLGDGMLMKTTAGYCFRAHHGLAQRVLVDWKYDNLRAFVRTAPRVCRNGYYFRTISHPKLAEFAAAFYLGSRKIVPLELLEEYLSPLALAVWIMDDGAADGKQLRINTQCFTAPECRWLTDLLMQKFGLRFSLNVDKRRQRLRCASGSMAELQRVVGRYILPELQYKLGTATCP